MPNFYEACLLIILLLVFATTLKTQNSNGYGLFDYYYDDFNDDSNNRQQLRRREATSARMKLTNDIPHNTSFYNVEYCSSDCNRYWINLRYPGDQYYARKLNKKGCKTNSSSDNYLTAFVHTKLSSAYRMAGILDLQAFNFSFPFYGQQIRDRIVISTGGFLHIGDVVNRHHFTESQYIAPLMANFDFSLDDSQPSRRLLYFINQTLLVVEWRNVSLQEYPDEPFTFQAQIHANGTIVLAYYNIPIEIHRIRKAKHPVKAGISDAYFSDDEVIATKKNKNDVGINFHVRLIPYSTIDVEPSSRIRSPTAVVLTFNEKLACQSKQSCGLCLPYDDEESYLIVNRYKKMRCTWCPQLGKCSSGYDRQRSTWLRAECDRENVSQIYRCPSNVADPANMLYFDLTSSDVLLLTPKRQATTLRASINGEDSTTGKNPKISSSSSSLTLFSYSLSPTIAIIPLIINIILFFVSLSS